MKGTLSNVLIFAAGAVVGSVVTGLIAKNTYEQLIQEEIESVKEAFIKKQAEQEEPEETEDEIVTERPVTTEKPDLMEYAARLAAYKTDVTADDIQQPTRKIDVEDELDYEDAPYPIKPESLGDDEFNTEYLTLYEDDVLADNRGNPVKDIKGMVGSNYQQYFGVYEDDLVCIRNERLRTDFEICRDSRSYSDIYHIDPREGSDE